MISFVLSLLSSLAATPLPAPDYYYVLCYTVEEVIIATDRIAEEGVSEEAAARKLVSNLNCVTRNPQEFAEIGIFLPNVLFLDEARNLAVVLTDELDASGRYPLTYLYVGIPAK